VGLACRRDILILSVVEILSITEPIPQGSDEESSQGGKPIMQPWLEGWMEKVSQGSLRRRRSLVVFEVKCSLQVVWVYGFKHLRRSWNPRYEGPVRRPRVFFSTGSDRNEAEISHEG
jgi:hypothetical protein